MAKTDHYSKGKVKRKKQQLNRGKEPGWPLRKFTPTIKWFYRLRAEHGFTVVYQQNNYKLLCCNFSIRSGKCRRTKRQVDEKSWSLEAVESGET